MSALLQDTHQLPSTNLLNVLRVRVTLQLTVCQSVRLVVEPTLGLVTRCCFPLEGKYLNVVVLYFVERPL
jgi:hypothetical protein